MAAVLRAEWIKYRRTVTWWLLGAAPVALVAFLTWYVAASGRLRSWADLANWLYEFWTMAWLPVGAALLAGLAANYEVQAGNWVGLRARPMPAGRLYAGKLIVLCGHVLLSTLLLAGLSALAGRLAGLRGEVPWGLLLLPGLLSWLAALPLLSGQLWLATARGFGASLAVGSLGLLLGALIGGTGLGTGVWPLVPWAWPSRIIGPVVAAHAGGPAAPGQTLLAGGLAMALALVLSLAGVAWFERHEVM